jgi:hypothetical protein
MAGLDPATQRARVGAPKNLFARQTQHCRMGGSEDAHGEWD